MTSQPPFDTDHEMVINCAQFDVCTPSSFRGVMTDRHTYRFAIKLAGSADVARRAPSVTSELKISLQLAKPASLIVHLCEQKLFNGKPISGFGAAPFLFIFAVLSSLAALFALFPA